ncbi:hypothetical protein EV13_1757 [Prochlorococcus sp. MIT 0702]|nr:hypothetical protein EV12_1506 [Prochlorococcus sp. MIT 0701]KGG27864.1 hypothetical protein EV13_1757 [Prochlorococcus sp. MIT 0702]KGG31413.1 hypothetical protein EV14_2364 [Prochlorococcus sp. MIT 0703]
MIIADRFAWLQLHKTDERSIKKLFKGLSLSLDSDRQRRHSDQARCYRSA